jgi:hypothetical protein
VKETRLGDGLEQLNPDGNERLTAAVGIVLVVLTVAELATVLFGGTRQRERRHASFLAGSPAQQRCRCDSTGRTCRPSTTMAIAAS